MGSGADDRVRTIVYRDTSGAAVADPAEASEGEIVEEGGDSVRRHAWFRIQEVELDWLPVRESAFLLWVLALLAAVWLAIGVVLHFT